MSGHGDEDLDGNFVGGPGSITGSSLYDLDSLPQSGKVVLTETPTYSDSLLMFSEVSSLASSVHGVSKDPEEFIPKFIESLSDEDPLVVDTVVGHMEKFSKKETFLKAIVQSEPLIKCLVNVLNGSTTFLAGANPKDTQVN